MDRVISMLCVVCCCCHCDVYDVIMTQFVVFVKAVSYFWKLLSSFPWANYTWSFNFRNFLFVPILIIAAVLFSNNIFFLLFL